MKKHYKITSLILLITTIISVSNITSYAAEKVFKADSFENTLEPGYYSKVTIDASKVYTAGLKAGKANSTVETNVNSLIVNPGDYGSFSSDGVTTKKTFSSANMSKFTMDVEPVDIMHIFNKWDIKINNNAITYTALWSEHTPIYSFTSTGKGSTSGGAQEFIAPATGSYQITLYGAQGGPNGYTEYPNFGRPRGSYGKGAMTQGTISLNKGDKLYVYVGNAYGQAADIRLSQNDENTRIMVAGAGGEAAGYTYSLNGGNAGGLYGGSGAICDYGGSYKSMAGGTQTGSTCSSDGVTIATRCGNVSYDYDIYIAGGYKYNPGARTYGMGSYANGYRTNYVETAGGGSSYISGYSGCTTYSDTWKFSDTTMSAACHTGVASASIRLLSLAKN